MIFALLFFVVGLAVARLARPWLPASRLGWGSGVFLLGVGTHGAALFVLGMVGVPVGWVTVLGATAAAVVAILGRGQEAGRRGQEIAGQRPASPLLPPAPCALPPPPLSTILLIVPFLVAAFCMYVIPLSDYDGRTTWMPKAEAIAREGSIRGPFFHGERGLNLHNHYPLLLPLDAASVLVVGGNPRVLFLLIPLAMLLFATAALQEMRGPPAAWVVAALAWLPQVVAAPEGGAMSAYSDLAVAAFFGAAVLAAMRDDFRGTALWLTFLVLTKNEGTMLALALIAAVVLTKRKVLFAALPIAAAALLALWRSSIPAAYDERYEALLRELPRQWHRLDDALIALARHAIDPWHWGLFWPAVLLAGVMLLVRRQQPATSTQQLTIALLLAVAGYAITLTVTSWNIDELAGVAADRLLVQLIIPAAALLAAALQAASRKAETAGTNVVDVSGSPG